MEIFTSFSELQAHQVGAVTIGNFDGLHLGHQNLVQALKRLAGNLPCLLVTFDPHPREVLCPGAKIPRLMEWEDLVDELKASGVNYVLRLRFDDKLKKTSAEDFMIALWKATSFRSLVIGHDFALGAQREGDGAYLSKWCEEKGAKFLQIPPFSLDGEVVSSQRIRESLMAGDVEKAALLLGRPFHLQGEVMRGDSRGRTLNFPTANLRVCDQLIKPRQGVYGGKAFVKGRSYFAVCNVGKRPTFKDEDPVTIEVHLLDFSEEIYEESLRFEFLFHLRDEKKFSSKEELIRQIQQDIHEARGKFNL